MPRKKNKARKFYYKRLSRKKMSKILRIDYDKLIIDDRIKSNKEVL